jgi:hypothetical protein
MKKRRRLIRDAINMDGHITESRMHALNQIDGFITTIDNAFLVDGDVLIAVRPQQFRQDSQESLIFALPFVTRWRRKSQSGCGDSSYFAHDNTSRSKARGINFDGLYLLAANMKKTIPQRQQGQPLLALRDGKWMCYAGPGK